MNLALMSERVVMWRAFTVILTQLAVFAHIGGRTVAFKVALQVPADASILTRLSGAVVHICREKKRQT